MCLLFQMPVSNSPYSQVIVFLVLSTFFSVFSVGKVLESESTLGTATTVPSGRVATTFSLALFSKSSNLSNSSWISASLVCSACNLAVTASNLSCAYFAEDFA